MKGLASAPAFALSLALLAGCAAPEDPSVTGLTSHSEPGLTDGNQGEDPPTPYSLDFFLTASYGLSTEPQEAGTVPVTDGFGDAEFLAGRKDLRPWKSGSPLVDGFVVTRMSLEIWYTSDAPQQEVGTGLGFTPLGLWFGEEHRWGFDQLDGAPNQVTPGQIAHVAGEIDLPLGGLVFGEGATPAIIVGFFYTQTPGSPMKVHVGDQMPSRLNLTVVPYRMPEFGGSSSSEYAGDFAYNSPFAPNPADDNKEMFEVVVNQTTARLQVIVEGETTAGNQDLDLYLKGPNGDQVQASTSPGAQESVVLYDVQLAKIGYGTYVVELVNFQTVAGAYKVTILVDKV